MEGKNPAMAHGWGPMSGSMQMMMGPSHGIQGPAGQPMMMPTSAMVPEGAVVVSGTFLVPAGTQLQPWIQGVSKEQPSVPGPMAMQFDDRHPGSEHPRAPPVMIVNHGQQQIWGEQQHQKICEVGGLLVTINQCFLNCYFRGSMHGWHGMIEEI